MNNKNESCDLCGLDVEISGFSLNTPEGRKNFCCEGCKGIFELLNHDLVLPDIEQSSSH